ncbi:hypothetical protein ONS95_007912 [Cadophora gregata]|uniref:uncharacterized protein n=1 Tax=Cadophora gregata TaxID=51156 RepID=UPI0026DB7319|nr:uncharacterized protein ONS95_007912 [Cadophora gregata]KAK0119049.1 hypothetical protein ONS96_012117 [Cadophora gregata f. sp. sojae]KAK0126302.1 hypothetical protein ONS95_007912 [Cadophora gregata]
MNANGVLYSKEDFKPPIVSPAPIQGSAFSKLPDEIIEQILQLTNPNVFASLILLNRKWRTVSQQAHLYAHHLSRCPSYAAAHRSCPISVDEKSLPHLRRLFARETKRNLFEAYLRPTETIIQLVSTSISSSSAPGGEAFHFSLSPRGHYILAYSSSRIHVLDVTGPEIAVKRELKILRRPASTTITDDGVTLAVLSTDLQVDLYDLSGEHPKHTRAVALDHTPRTIALSPTGSVLAAAYDSGVEVSSLDPIYASTDRRSVKCYAADSLSFSRDGTQLLGTTMQSRNPSTVILTAPYYDPSGSLPEDSVSSLWTTSILFPNGSRDCSHAVLLPSSSDGEVTWAFTYDRILETFRTVRIDDLRNGTTYFTGPIAESVSTSRLLPSTLPAASESGDLVASGFQSSIWLYGVPEDLEAIPNTKDSLTNSPESGVSTPASYLGRRNSAPSLSSVSRTRDSISRTPQWQLLGDKFRNTFVEGRKVGSLDRVSALAWVNTDSSTFHVERLVAVAPGVGGLDTVIEDDGMNPVDGGRISILDFAYAPSDGEKIIITIEVGMNEPEVLEEEHRDLDAEVAIVRRRTVAQRRGNRSHVSRSASTQPLSPRSDPPAMPVQDMGDLFSSRNPIARRVSQQTTSTERSETTSSLDEDHDAFDDPYSHTNPRSGTTLRRAATAAAVNRRFHPRVGQEHIEYRRADGREEHPHESDADNWVPPPPPYTRDPLPPLPEHIQRSLLAEAAAATLERSRTHRAPSLDFPGLDSSSLHRSHTIATMASSSTAESRRERFQFHRTMSDDTNMNSDRVSFEEDPRPMTSPREEFDDLYDVSPQGSPQPSPRPQTATINQIPRRPVGAPSNVLSNLPAPSTPSSPPPVMLATLNQPASPIPQPPQPPDMTSDRDSHSAPTTKQYQLAAHLAHREAVPASTGHERARSQAFMEVVSANTGHGMVRSEGDSSQAQSLNKQVPPRPDDNHHLNELPPPAPVPHAQQRIIESWQSPPRRSETVPLTASPPQDMDSNPLPIWRRAETAPVTAQDSNAIPPSLVLPSADQVARLNSRKGRPRGLSDPRRPSGGSHNRTASGGSTHNAPAKLTPEQAFNAGQSSRGLAGAYGSSPQRYSQGPSPQGSPYSSSPSRRPSGNNHNRSPSGNSSNLRPPMPRLETIHSQTSDRGEPSPFFGQKSTMVGRQPSRAERSAAKNIKDAKKRGWRASMRKEKKDKFGDGASSAGWTDVSRESGMPGNYGEKEKKEGKCVVM